MAEPLRLGTRTLYGEVLAVGTTGGERYYWLDKAGVIAMVPWFMVEPTEGAHE